MPVSESFTSAFLPLFIAIDAIGVVPIFMSLTDDATAPQRRRLAVQAVTTALIVSLVIVLAGEALFRVLGITLNDLRVGGGIILLVLAITELFFGEKKQRTTGDEAEPAPDRGIVPLGIPLVCGPAAITTLMVSQQAYGTLVTTASLIANLAIVLVVFWGGPWLLARLGSGTSKAIAKVVNLFLAAIAVALIRAGVVRDDRRRDAVTPGARPPRPLPGPLALVGTGALGAALADRARARGLTLGALVSRAGRRAAALAARYPPAPPHGKQLALVGDAPLVGLCVPDAALPGVAAALVPAAGPWEGRLVFHTSGALPAAVLAPLADAGAEVLAFHPAQTFVEGATGAAFDGITVALEGTPAAVAAGHRLGRVLGVRTFELPASGKAAYHLALTIASNYTVTLAALAAEVLGSVGLALPDALALVRPLLAGTLANLQQRLPERALSGPVARGDLETVARHLATLQATLPHLVPVYSALGLETVRVAVRGGRLDAPGADALLAQFEAAIELYAPPDAGEP